MTAPDISAPPGETALMSAARARNGFSAMLADLDADPRHFQILALSTLLVLGLGVLDFSISARQIGLTLTAALATEWLARGLLGAGRVDLRSPLISALSLCLLLRVDDPHLAAFAASLAIGSKFLLRTRRGHVFNPTALAIAVTVLVCDGAWVSPGQWGQSAATALVAAGLGLLVLTRARRLDVMLAFLSSWCVALLLRAAFYGDPLTIPLHQMSNGALVLFAFFMITDPRTSPDGRGARLVFAVLVAAVAAGIAFSLHRADALILALAACGPLCPLLDALIPSPTAGASAMPHHHQRSLT